MNSFKQELLCSQKRQVRTFLEHLNVNSNFLLVNQSINPSSEPRTSHPPLKSIIALSYHCICDLWQPWWITRLSSGPSFILTWLVKIPNSLTVMLRNHFRNNTAKTLHPQTSELPRSSLSRASTWRHSDGMWTRMFEIKEAQFIIFILNLIICRLHYWS